MGVTVHTQKEKKKKERKEKKGKREIENATINSNQTLTY